jgi:hypothetical protein
MDQRAWQPPQFTLIQFAEIRPIVGCHKRAIDSNPLVVVDVTQPADGPQQLGLFGAGHSRRQLGGSAHFSPAVVPDIDVFQIETSLFEILGEGNVAKRSQFAAFVPPGTRDGVANTVQHDPLRNRVELKVAASR